MAAFTSSGRLDLSPWTMVMLAFFSSISGNHASISDGMVILPKSVEKISDSSSCEPDRKVVGIS